MSNLVIFSVASMTPFERSGSPAIIWPIPE